MKQVEQLTGGDWVPAHSMIYRLLESLEKEGYLTSHKNHKGGVERTAYQSTDKGAELLREAVARMSALLSTMVTIQQPPPALDISRMLLEELPASERRAFLMRIRDWFRARLADVEQELSKIQSG
jgi:DNA-binding PadR family transcriptional regulator